MLINLSLRQLTSQRGFAAFYLAVLTLAVLSAAGSLMGFLTVSRQKTLNNYLISDKAYYAAESGLEDALLRLSKGINWSSPYSFVLEGTSVEVDIVQDVSGAKIITAEANAASRIRKVQAVYELSSTEAEFFYGAQVGDGGLVMKNNSIVNGNIFSDGRVTGENNPKILGTLRVAGTANDIVTVDVSGDAHVQHCDNSDITGTLYAITQNQCSYGTLVSQSPPSPIPLPIPQADIDGWKQDAQDGGIIGSQILSGGTTYLGPVKIAGNIEVKNDARLIMRGTIWVTGNVTIQNDARVSLDLSYGPLSGIIIADGLIDLKNNTVSSGSGSAGSYLMYLSTSAANPALTIQNNAVADILYTSNGWIVVKNNAQLRQITGYGIEVQNNAVVNYEIGLQDASFTSGPGASWQVRDWKEVE